MSCSTQNSAGVSGGCAPEALPAETRRAILSGARTHGVKLTAKTTPLKPNDDDEEF